MIRACQLCKSLPLIAAFVLAGCGGGGGVEGDDRQDPPPPPDSTQRSSTGFEAEEGIAAEPDGSFTLGERPISAKFSGGELMQTRLAHTGEWAWIIEEGDTATIEFTTPLSEMVLWFTNESESVITVEPDPDANTKPVCGIDDQGFDNTQYFGTAMFARGAFNDWGNSGLGAEYQFINFGDEVYQAEFDIEEAGTYAFKIADGGWGIEYGNPDVDFVLDLPVELSGGAALGGANSRLVVPNAGCYNLEMTLGSDLSTPPPVATLVVTEIDIDAGDAQLARSVVRIFDVNGVEIATFDGLVDYQRIEMIRAFDESLIRRVVIESIPGSEETSPIGQVAVDDFRFGTRPDERPRQIALYYSKADGDYSETEIEITLSDGTVIREDCVLTQDSAFGCVVEFESLPGVEIVYTVFNDGVPDLGSPVAVETVDATAGEIYAFASSDTPLFEALPVLPQNDNEVILYYFRPDGDYDGWGLHLFREDAQDWTVFEGGEYPFAGIDEQFGAYFIIGLPDSERLTAPYSNDPEPVDAFPDNLGLVIHRGDLKDPGQDQFIRLAEDGNILFVTSGVLAVANTPPIEGAVNIVGSAAHWIAGDTLLWDPIDDADEVASARLYHSNGASILTAGTRLIGEDGFFELTAGAANPFAEDSGDNRHLAGLAGWTLPPEAVNAAKELLKDQLVAVAFDDDGNRVAATNVQIPLVLDDLYAENAADVQLGVSFIGSTPRVRVWAPTANDVALNMYVDPTSDVPDDPDGQPMTFDANTGVWSIQGNSSWNRMYYTFAVNVYSPSAGEVVDNVVTDPYSLSLSAGSTVDRLAKSQIVNLNDTDLQPDGWLGLEKPSLEAPEDIVLYELHVRDFSVRDESVPEADRGRYAAFAGSGAGVQHLSAMADAGLTHVHILPSFDIATVNEDASQRVETTDPVEALCSVVPAAQSLCDDFPGMIIEDVMAAQPAASALPQQIADWLKDVDGFNWGYDPFHYTVPEGSYASDPEGTTRIREFREMVKGLSDIGLRTVMDVVYNHTNAAGNTSDKSVLDRIVPGYYHRQDAETGVVLSDSCCPDTESEHAMMEKLMIDSLVTWAKAYKVDGFRFDIMGFHSLQTLEKARTTLQTLTLANDGVDGSRIYLYGEGWNFGDVANDRRFEQATQANVAGTGIGTFNDRMRDAVRGGGPFDTGLAHERNQGLINGQFYDPNDQNSGDALELGGLLGNADLVRLSMVGNLRDYEFVNSAGTEVAGKDVFYNGQMAGYTLDPQEIINYAASHDGETLWDISVFKHPTDTTPAERSRAQNVANSILLLGQGVPFLHAGQDMLRSKSMDRNSFDSGDWFNRLDFSYSDNNFGVGEPRNSENAGSLAQIREVLTNPLADPGSTEILAAVNHALEMLEIRGTSRLFRLRRAEEIVNRVQYHNTGPDQVPGLIVQSINDFEGDFVDFEKCSGNDLDLNYSRVVTLVNASVTDHTFDLFADATFDLHPVLQASADATVRTATHGAAGFFVPARTAAVFVEPESAVDCGVLGRKTYLLGTFNFFRASDDVLFDLVGASVADVALDLASELHFFRIADDDQQVVNCGAAVAGTSIALDEPVTLFCDTNAQNLQLDLRDEPAGEYNFNLDASDPDAPVLTVVSTAADEIEPTVSIIEPVQNATVAGNVVIRATASDNVGVVTTRFFVDGALIGSDETAEGNEYSLTWDSATVPDGLHALSAEAEDAQGNVGTSGFVLITVDSSVLDDDSPPEVTLDPVPGLLVGEQILSAQASDPQGGTETPTGVAEVRFYYDLVGGDAGPVLIDSTSSEPYSITWDTTTVANADYDITAEAVDGAGNSAQSAAQTTTIDNPGTYGADIFVCGLLDSCANVPAPGAQLVFAGNDTFTGTFTLAGATEYALRVVDSDGAAVGAVLDCGSESLYTPLIPGRAFTLDCSTGSNDALLDLSLEGAGDFLFTLDASDDANPVLTITPVLGDPSVGAGDVTPPTVEVSGVTPGPEPLALDQVISALASDTESDVVAVDFFVDGELIWSDSTEPYEAPWDTLGVGNGSHDLTASATDAAGNTATSAALTVAVDNVGPYGVNMYPRGSWDLQFDVLPGQLDRPMDYLGAGIYEDELPDGLLNDDGDPLEIGNSTVRFKIASVDFTEADTNCNPPVDNTPAILDVPLQFVCSAAAGNAKFDVSLEDPASYRFRLDASRSVTDPLVTVSRVDPLPPPTGTDTTPPTFLADLALDPPDSPVTFGVTIDASVTDDNVIAFVQFEVDGELIWTDFTDPFQAPWDSTLVENGPHTITATATDADGNQVVSDPLFVTVDNPDFGPFGVQMFVRGQFTGDSMIDFTPIHELALIDEGGSVYEVVIPITSPSPFIRFKVADQGWTDGTNCGNTQDGPSSFGVDITVDLVCNQADNGNVDPADLTLNLFGEPLPGDYRFEVDATGFPATQPTVRVEIAP